MFYPSGVFMLTLLSTVASHWDVSFLADKCGCHLQPLVVTQCLHLEGNLALPLVVLIAHPHTRLLWKLPPTHTNTNTPTTQLHTAVRLSLPPQQAAHECSPFGTSSTVITTYVFMLGVGREVLLRESKEIQWQRCRTQWCHWRSGHYSLSESCCPLKLNFFP